MRRNLVLSAGLCLFAGSQSFAQATSKHIFFGAFQHGDTQRARTLIDGNIEIMPEERSKFGRDSISVTEFFERIKPCYFRVGLVRNDDPNTEAGVWMCALTPSKVDPNLSKTIVVLASFKGERVTLNSYIEFESMKPAPAPGE